MSRLATSTVRRERLAAARRPLRLADVLAVGPLGLVSPVAAQGWPDW